MKQSIKKLISHGGYGKWHVERKLKSDGEETAISIPEKDSHIHKWHYGICKCGEIKAGWGPLP